MKPENRGLVIKPCRISAIRGPDRCHCKHTSRSPARPFNMFFFKYNFIYLIYLFGWARSSLLCVGFLWLQWAGAILSCSVWASHHGGFSCGAWALSMQASVVTAHGLNCSIVCRIFPDQGLNLCPLHWQADSYPLYHQGSPLVYSCLTPHIILWMSVLKPL